MKRRIKTLLSIGLALLLLFLSGCLPTDTETTGTHRTDPPYDQTQCDYSLVKHDGKDYIVFNDPSVYKTPSVQVAGFYFDSVKDLSQTVKSGALTPAQKRNIVQTFPQDDHGFPIADLDHLLIPVVPDDYPYGKVYWNGFSYGFAATNHERKQSVEITCYTEDWYTHTFQERYEKPFSNMGGITVEYEEERNATIYSYNSCKNIRYTLQTDTKQIIVDEFYAIYYEDAALPQRLVMYVTETFDYGTQYYTITFIEWDHRPSVEWLLQWGVEPYVDTPAE